jgi:flavin reductase (DIM6/NTAB) family NADH-FMN oxidoreductase RutF
MPSKSTDIPKPPDFDARAFRTALGSFPTGVAIITTSGADGEPIGLTCNSFSSVSLEPPLVSWSLRLSSKNLESFQQAPVFAINILAEDQKELSGRFASSSIVDKFDGVAHSRGHRDLPLIDDCVATFECVKFAEHAAGDHLLFLGQVVQFNHGRQEDSLVFYKGAYMMLTQSLRELAAKGRVDPANLDQARRLVNCMLLRLACENGSDSDFDEIEANIRKIEGYTAAEDRDKRGEASVDFFRLITEAAHNEVLAVVSESLTTILRHVLKAEPNRMFRPDLVLVRKRILRHLRAREAHAAELEMNRYFDELRGGFSDNEGSR